MAINDNLEAWWMLNEESGTRYDVHGSNDLADNATVLYGTGNVNNAADFERDNSEFLSIADNASLSMGDIDFTLVAWIKLETLPSSVASGYCIMSKDDAANNREYRLGVGSDDKPAIFVADNDVDAAITAWGSTISTGTWYFVVGYHDASGNEIGISVDNGTFVTAAYSGGVADSTAVFEIGALREGATTQYFDGLIDEVGVWKRKLTSTEITALYNSGSGITYTCYLTPSAASCISASTAPQVRERIVGVIASAVAAVTAPQVRERVTNKIASAIAATTAPVVGIWEALRASFHDYFFTAPQHFTISSNSIQLEAPHHDYTFTAPKRE